MTPLPSALGAAVRAAYESALADQRPSAAELQWRLTRFDRGLRLVEALEQLGWPVRGLDVADLGAAHGGDSCAFVSAGARVICMDFRDYHYRRLKEVLVSLLGQSQPLTGIVANATAALPLRNGVANLALCLNIIEHVPDLDGFFGEVHRILRPGGIAVVIEDVPLKSRGYDGLFHVPFIAVLPMPLRRLIAERVLGKRYPFPLANRTFYSAATISRPAERADFEVSAHRYPDNPSTKRVAGWPLASFWLRLLRHYAFDFLILYKRR